jgi:hypothetical protein
MNTNITETGFIVQEYDLANDTITVTPYITSFKNPISSYPSYNISISNLDMSIDINSQIALMVGSIIKSTLTSESNTFSNITSALDSIVNIPVSMTYATLFEQLSSKVGVDMYTSNAVISTADVYSALNNDKTLIDLSAINIDGITFI